MDRYVIYARKSSESEDRQALSIESQIREMRQLALRHQVTISEVLSESRSAKAPGRPIFGQLMRRIQRGEVRGVLCWKMDRLARNPYDSGLVLQAQADGKLDRIITSDGVKTANGNDRLMGTFELAFATKFIDDLRANVKRGNRARFEKGWPNHLPPIGYLNDPTTKTIVKDAERFMLVRRMWDALLEGQRPKHIAQTASRDWGLRTVRRGRIGGNPIAYSSIYKVFTNPYYAGFIHLKDGRRYLGAHEPMITSDEYERAQKLLGRRSPLGYGKHENHMAGLMRCGHCGCSIVAEHHPKRGRVYTYHRCSHSKPGVTCRERPISDRALRDQLRRYFAKLVIPEPILEFLRSRLDRLDSVGMDSTRAVEQQWNRALVALRREEQELLGMRMRRLLTDDEFQSERASLQRRRQDLEDGATEHDDVQGLQAKRHAEVAGLLDLVHGAPLLLEHGAPVQLRSLLQQLQLNIVLRGGRLDISVSEPLSHLVQAGSNSSWCATWCDIWKWIVFGAQADQMGISDAELRRMMGEAVPLVQGRRVS